MSKQDFENFLKKEEKKTPNIDWGGRKQWWLEQIEKLYEDIKSWLNEYVNANKVSIQFSPIDIYEDVLGTYNVEQMIIKIGDKIVTLTPIGTILIGTKGRVDMSGIAGTKKLVLADKQSTGLKFIVQESSSDEDKKEKDYDLKSKTKYETDWVWKISSNPPKIKHTDLEEDSFLQCLIEVCNA